MKIFIPDKRTQGECYEKNKMGSAFHTDRVLYGNISCLRRRARRPHERYDYRLYPIVDARNERDKLYRRD